MGGCDPLGTNEGARYFHGPIKFLCYQALLVFFTNKWSIFQRLYAGGSGLTGEAARKCSQLTPSNWAPSAGVRRACQVSLSIKAATNRERNNEIVMLFSRHWGNNLQFFFDGYAYFKLLTLLSSFQFGGECEGLSPATATVCDLRRRRFVSFKALVRSLICLVRWVKFSHLSITRLLFMAGTGHQKSPQSKAWQMSSAACLSKTTTTKAVHRRLLSLKISTLTHQVICKPLFRFSMHSIF